MTRRAWITAAAGVSAGGLAAVWAANRDEREAAARFDVVGSYPHDPDAFCQGLALVDGRLYESTGQYGESSVREVEKETGKVLRQSNLREEYFGEGVAAWEDTLYQLTWRNGVALVYDRATLRYLRSYPYSGEGWGLTHDGQRLYMSDGTSTIRLMDPRTFRVQGVLRVREGSRPVANLNELEWVDGEIYANVWKSDRIVRISPRTGEVLGWIDASGLRKLLPDGPESGDEDGVLNGIAYDAATKRLFLTGKYWPKLFEVRVVSNS